MPAAVGYFSGGDLLTTDAAPLISRDLQLGCHRNETQQKTPFDGSGDSTFVKVPAPVPVHVSLSNTNDYEVPEHCVLLMRLVKQYAHLKTDMNKCTAKDIADELYQHELKLLSDIEALNHCQSRRECVEWLLKKVVMGSPQLMQFFVSVLREYEKWLADDVEQTELKDIEKRVFMAAEAEAEGKGRRLDAHERRLKLSSSDFETLTFYLNDKTEIDKVNDHMLSRFYFTIRDHNRVCNCVMNDEARVKCLLNSIENCSEKVFDPFCDMLRNETDLEHVVRKLEKFRKMVKRKACDESDPSTSTGSSAKRNRVESAVEKRLVQSLQNARAEELNRQTAEFLGFNLDTVNSGSIVLQLSPKSAESWQKLKDSCFSGKIKDLIPVVYKDESIKDLLSEGEYRLKFTIYSIPAGRDQTGAERKAMFHLETDVEDDVTSPTKQPASAGSHSQSSTHHHENPILDHMSFLTEELDYSPKLLDTFVKEELVTEEEKEEFNKLKSRSAKIKLLLKTLSTQGDRAYQVLLTYLKENKMEYILKQLQTKEGVHSIGSKLEQAASVGRKSRVTPTGKYSKELFFTGTVVMKIKKTAGQKENKDPSKDGTGLEVKCPDILNPVCHFKMSDGGKSGEDEAAQGSSIRLVFEEMWDGVAGSTRKPEREILIGKRKKDRQAAGSQSKRLEHTPETDNTEDQDLGQTEKEKFLKSSAPSEVQSIDTGDNKSTSKSPKGKKEDEKD